MLFGILSTQQELNDHIYHVVLILNGWYFSPRNPKGKQTSRQNCFSRENVAAGRGHLGGRLSVELRSDVPGRDLRRQQKANRAKIPQKGI